MGTTVTDQDLKVFADHYLRGRSLVEIAKITGKAKSTIQRHLADMGFKGVRGSANFVNPLADALVIEIDESGEKDALPTNVEIPAWITDLQNMVDLIGTLKADNKQLVDEVNSLRRQASVIQAQHEKTVEHWIAVSTEKATATSDTQHGKIMREARKTTGR
jgi:hypothetical protein